MLPMVIQDPQQPRVLIAPPHHWLKLHPANAVLATEDHPAHLVNRAEMDAMVSMVCQESLVIAVHQLHQHQNWYPKCPINARAKLHLAMQAHQVQKAQTDHPEMQAHREQMANQEIKAQEDHPAHQAHPELQERKDHLAILAKLPAPNQAHLAHQDHQESQVHPAHQVAQESQDTMAIQADQVQLAIQVQLEAQANQEAPEAQEMQVVLDHQEAATIAHLHVWLLVIKLVILVDNDIISQIFASRFSYQKFHFSGSSNCII